MNVRMGNGHRTADLARALVAFLLVAAGLQGIAATEATAAGPTYGQQVAVISRGPTTPLGMALAPGGVVYVADRANNQVLRLEPSGAESVVPFTGLNEPEDVSRDPAGNLYVSDNKNHRVVKLTPAGVQSVVPFTGLTFPGGLHVTASGDVYVLSGDRLLKLSSSGVQTVVASGLNNPHGVTVDDLGTAWVANTGSNQVIRIAADGATLAIEGWMGPDTEEPDYPYKAFNTPIAVTVTSTGTVLVTERLGLARVIDIGTTTQIRPAKFPVVGSGPTPEDMVMGSDGTMYFSTSRQGGEIHAWAPGAAQPVVRSFGGLVDPMYLASNGGDVYVGDNGKGTVVKVDPTNSWGGRVLVDNLFSTPFAVDDAGDVYVGVLNDVRKYKSADASFTDLGFTDLAFGFGVAVDSAGSVYVADTSNKTVVKRTSSGTQSELPFAGLVHPLWVAVDSAGSVYVAEHNRVLKLTSSGTQSVLPFVGLSDIKGLAVDNAGYVYVTDETDKRVLRLDPSGNQVVLPFTGLVRPNGVAVDDAGNVFVADRTGYRVLKLPVVGAPDAPGVPGAPTAVAGQESAIVTVTPPTTGGTPTSYTVTSSPGGKTCTVTGASGSCTVTGLSPGQSYTFTATATNAGGTSASSPASNAVLPQAGGGGGPQVPGVPGAPTAVAGDGQATVTVVPPTSGGTPTSYTVRSNPEGKTCTVTGASGSCTVTGLTNGQSYTFDASASNSAGGSAQSAPSNAVTPQGKTAQAITFTTNPPGSPVVGGSHDVNATGGGSGNAVTFSVHSSTTNDACTVNASTGEVSFDAAGSCVIAANQAGNAEYAAAPQELYPAMTVGKKSQTISFTSTAPSTATIGETHEVTATGGGSGSPVRFAVHESTTNGACTIDSTTGVVRFVRVGSCVVAADQAGDAEYTAASQKMYPAMTVVKKSQTIAFTTSPPASATIGGSHDIDATGGSSGSPVTFSVHSSTTNGACTVNASTGVVSFVAAGSCVIAADQAGDDEYSAAAQKLFPAMTVVKKSQAIAFTTSPPASAVIGGSHDIDATGGGSANAVTFSVHSSTTNGACAVNASTGVVSFAAVGSCVIAADQSESSDYDAAPQKLYPAISVRKESQCTRVGTPGPERLVGTDGRDRICGRGGDDRLIGRGGEDRIIGGAGNDVLGGGPGNDLLDGRDADRFVDRLRCGPGERDKAIADPGDVVAKSCEVVVQNDPPRSLIRSG